MDYADSTARSGRRVALIGNGQVHAMAQLYRRFVAARTGDVVDYVASYENVTPEARAIIEGADLIVEQLFDVKQQAETTGLAAATPRLYIPMVTAAFLWPFAGQAHPKNTPLPWLPSGPYGGEASDSCLNQMIAAGKSAENSVEIYANLGVKSRVNLDRLYELVMDRQRSRDQAADYHIADLIERYFRTEQVFMSPYHPNLRIALALATRFFQQMGARQDDIDLLHNCVRVTPFPKTELPLHPDVCRHFGLTYVGPDRRYRFMSEGSFTFRQHALRYMKYEWNEALEEGTRLRQAGNMEMALGQLTEGLRQSPESAAGHAALSHILVQSGDTDRALAEITRAVEIEPDFGPHHAALGALLRRLGRLEEAEAEFLTAILLDPTESRHYVLLAHLLRQRGALTESRDIIRKALAFDPYSAQIRAEVADFAEAAGVRSHSSQHTAPPITETKAEISPARSTDGDRPKHPGRAVLSEASRRFGVTGDTIINSASSDSPALPRIKTASTPSDSSSEPAQGPLMTPLPALIFCTCYADSLAVWESRYRRWITAVRRTGLTVRQILIVDDGSPCVPDWPDATFVDEGAPIPADAQLVVYRFKERLGRAGTENYPGWYRSFCFAGRYATQLGVEKVVHIESDAFLISSRIQETFNNFREGWASVYVERYSMPESAIQVIAGSSIDALRAFSETPYQARIGKAIENVIPFTHVFKEFKGGRYGETLDYVPLDAEWAVQIFPPLRDDDRYYWWLQDRKDSIQDRPSVNEIIEKYRKIPDTGDDIRHTGVNYPDFLRFMDGQLRPSTYLEIGTNTGDSLSTISCDAICIDPNFMISHNAIASRSKALFFQTTSDEFFRSHNPKDLLGNIDLGFLDGMHQFEYLLRDFVNFEKFSHLNSMALLHDCLPLNNRMAERTFRIGIEPEPEGIRDYWTGDVWRMLAILRDYRPDLEILLIDCPPTGLVMVSRLNDRSTDLLHSYNTIVKKYGDLDLESYSLSLLWNSFPMLSSRQIIADPVLFRNRYKFHG